MDLPGQAGSYWVQSTAAQAFPPLQGVVRVDVAVIGGGMVGLTAADLLKRAGRSVALIEARRVGAQVTGRSTAKLTALHGVIYDHLIRNFGLDAARLYAEANQSAIDYIEALATERGIDCDFERNSAWTYSEGGAGLSALHAEAEAAARIKLPLEFVAEPPLPFAAAGAVRLDRQARFNPFKYLQALAQGIPGEGSHVFEQTRVLEVEQGRPTRVAAEGGTVYARDVIIATNLPFPRRSLFFARVFPKRHAVLASRIEAANAPDGMFISVDTPSWSFRTQPDPEGLLLISVGPGFKTGHADTEKAFRALEVFTRSHFPVQSVAWRWGNQDYYSPDRIPYVGKLTPASRRIYMATGFGGWGLTQGTAAARVLADHILERRNPWAGLYDAGRIKPRITGRALAAENLHTSKEWLAERLRVMRGKAVCDIARGEGAVCRHQGDTVAVYKSEQGQTHFLSPVCPHMGCLVQWNSAEKSWDCPCHGSRFSPEGKVLEGPALRDLAPREED